MVAHIFESVTADDTFRRNFRAINNKINFRFVFFLYLDETYNF